MVDKNLSLKIKEPSMSVSLIGSRISTHFSVYPPKLDILKGDVMGFSQELVPATASFAQSYQFDDEASLLGSDYSTDSDGASEYEQDVADSDIEMESPGDHEESVAYEASFEQTKKQLSQERLQFEEMARTHALAKTPNMTEARLNQVTNKLWKKYLASKQ